MAERFDWFVGIDWATVDHQVCVVDAAGGRCGSGRWRTRRWRCARLSIGFVSTLMI